MSATDFLVARSREAGADQVALVGKEKNGVAVDSEMNGGAMGQFGGLVGLPDLLAGARLHANQAATHLPGENMIAKDQGHGRVTDHPLGDGLLVPDGPRRDAQLPTCDRHDMDEKALTLNGWG